MLGLLDQSSLAYVELPLEPDQYQVIYVDSGTGHPLDRFVRENLRELKLIFNCRGLEFCYMPSVLYDEDDLTEKILYRVPWLSRVDRGHLDRLKASYTPMLREILRSADPDRVMREGGDKVLMRLSLSDPSTYMHQFGNIAEAYGEKVQEQLRERALDDPDILNLFRTLMEKKPKGLVREMIERELGNEEVLSRVEIRSNCSVVLPQYGRIIRLHPIEKTLFFLYLRHPEGIAFKDLVDYREEIFRIYGRLSNQSDPQRISAAVDRLFELDSNAVNEHRSRLKSAFEREFDSAIASRYYITGRRGETMRITLPRDLVDWGVQF